MLGGPRVWLQGKPVNIPAKAMRAAVIQSAISERG